VKCLFKGFTANDYDDDDDRRREGWETVDAQSYFVEKFKKKISTFSFFC
jgi:hypothetical protein